MTKTAQLHFFTQYDRAEIKEIKDGRLAHLVFRKHGQEFNVVFDLERQMVVGVYSKEKVIGPLTYAERSRLTYSLTRQMDSREGCFLLLYRCPKCHTYTTTSCSCRN